MLKQGRSSTESCICSTGPLETAKTALCTRKYQKKKYGKRLFKRIRGSSDTGIANGMFYAGKVPYLLSGKVFCGHFGSESLRKRNGNMKYNHNV